MRNLRVLLTTLIAFYLFPSPVLGSSYRDGDLIFQDSQSTQSRAVREATKSPWSHVGILFDHSGEWYVAEAVQPVRLTRLQSFIARGKENAFQIRRVPHLTEQQRRDLRTEALGLMGKNYDIFFEWSDDLIYCSEMVYKVFLKATGLEVGTIQKFKELNLDGPYVKDLIRRRFKDSGRTLNLDEPIVTPASQFSDSDLQSIEAFE